MSQLANIMDRPPAPLDGAGSQPVFVDGFGPRSLSFDPESSDPVEILSFDPELADAPDFAATLGVRAARLANARHTFYAHVRRLDRPSEHSLQLVSDYVPGWRLAQVLDVAERERMTIDISAVLSLLRQLIPAVSLFARHQRDLAVGAIGPERLIVTPQGRLVLAEYVLGPAIEKLQFTRERLWRELRVAVPASAGLARITPRADVLGIGVVTLSLIIGRRLRDDEYPGALVEMVRMATESTGGLVRPLSDGLAAWLGRALQLDGRNGFHTPQEAQVAFEELLASERGYVTSPAVLDALIARFAAIVGPPREPVVAAAPLPPLEPLISSGAASPLAPGARSESTGALRALPALPEGRERTESKAASPLAPAAVEFDFSQVQKPEDVVKAPREPFGGRLRAGLGVRRWTTGALAAIAVLALIEAVAIILLLNRGGASGLAGDGELVVSSRPAAARVSIDGEDRGATPLTVRLSPGTHILEVRVGRSEPRVIPLQIHAGVQTAQYLELQSVPTVGALEVTSDPPKARVTVDGQSRGVTPLVMRDLPPGEHEVILEGQGRKVRQMIRIEAGVTAQLVVPMGSQ